LIYRNIKLPIAFTSSNFRCFALASQWTNGNDFVRYSNVKGKDGFIIYTSTGVAVDGFAIGY
jgi:hypothetical protein